jgi:hypothetical protein
MAAADISGRTRSTSAGIVLALNRQKEVIVRILDIAA